MGDDLGKKINSQGYMAVSDVGRIAMGSSRSDWPLDRERQSEDNVRYESNQRTLV